MNSHLFNPIVSTISRASQVVPVVKSLPASAGDVRDVDLIPGLGRFHERENGNQLQCPCHMDRGAWWATVPGVGYNFNSKATVSDNIFENVLEILL